MKSYSRLLLASILLIGCAIAQPTLAAETDSKVWITLDQHTFELLQKIDPAIQSQASQALSNGLIINGQVAHDQIHIVAV
ncbi:MAG TPA: hypothetical protein VFP95_01615, partial [Gammaproteobacteria bacterium]|nr:hypothetical protein [Gammaproteobacteria bacterium]